MKLRLAYLLLGAGAGGGSHYAYRQYNPEKNVKKSSRDMIDAYVHNHNLEKGYLVNVLKSVGLMLKGFYHYGMDTKLEGFNFNSTYLRSKEVRDEG